MLYTTCLSLLLACSAASLLRAQPTPNFELKDGDRVVMVGSALIEREQRHGNLEINLHFMFPHARFTARNLGWSGDTVWGDARAGFGTQEDGFKKLVSQVLSEKPTVLILGYGTNELFAGPARIEQFVQGYERLLKAVDADKTRMVFLTPLKFEDHQYPKQRIDLSDYLKNLEPYRKAIRTVAEKHHGIYLPINFGRGLDNAAFTRSDDGILPDENNYTEFATLVAKELGFEFTGEAQLEQLHRFARLRPLILKKNELYFHRYRPQNDTYLFGFRKQEQGQNAKEVSQFDPMVEELDRKIIETKLKLAEAAK